MFEYLENILVNEAFVSAIVTIAAALWGTFKTTEFVRNARDSKAADYLAQVYNSIDSAVEHVYQTYVRTLKEARADGKLTDAERKEARDKALSKAITLAHEKGIRLMRDFDPLELFGMIEDSIRESKAQAGAARPNPKNKAEQEAAKRPNLPNPPKALQN